MIWEVASIAVKAGMEREFEAGVAKEPGTVADAAVEMVLRGVRG